MRALLVDQDGKSADALMRFLRTSGVVADAVGDGQEALELARLYDYDLVIADLALPDMDAGELVRRLRVARLEMPVIIMAGGTRADIRVKLFSAGADDVVLKPFDPSELLARMRAVLRRCRGFAEASLTVGPLTIRQDRREVLVDGSEVRLTGKEYAILELLVLRKGSVLTKDAFLNHLYGGMDEPEAKIIDVFVCKLRKKLAISGVGNMIATVWGRGYMLREPARDEARAAREVLSAA